MLKYLLDKLSIRPDRAVEKCRFFSDSERYETNALKCVQQLYVARMAEEWKEKDGLEFLKTNVNYVIQIIEQNLDPRIANYKKMLVFIIKLKFILINFSFFILDEKLVIEKHQLMFVDIWFYQNRMKYEDFYHK